MTWQPIETAPKDGTPLDLWADGYRWPDSKWMKSRDEWARWEGDAWEDVASPTHWMPLPAPPEPTP